jgi:hypothetical protein
MNERIKLLAEQAGFMLWRDESWNPGDVIDWSARYDDELEKFVELIVQDITSQVALFGVSNFENEDIAWTIKTVIESIKTRYKK